jgi:hypothetical protein
MSSPMTRNKLIELLEKELEYQKSIFGDYKNDPNLNIASLEKSDHPAKTSATLAVTSSN